MLLTFASAGLAGEDPLKVKDLTPVTIHPAPQHDPVVIVRGGQPVARIYVADPKPDQTLEILIVELIEAIRLSTGAELEIVDAMPPADQPAIVIGDCPASRAAGIHAKEIPVEGFVVKTAPGRVFLVGSKMDEQLFARSGQHDGTAWAVADFLERLVGVRWYWPIQADGRCVVEAKDLVVPPVHYSDAPVFRKRAHWPPSHYGAPWISRWFDKEHPEPPEALKGRDKLDMQPLLACLREGSSWPYVIKVHEPQGFKYWKSDEWFQEHAAMFARNADGSLNKDMLCYSSQATFDYLMAACEAAWGKDGKAAASWLTELGVCISPGDKPVLCQCDRCLPLYGSAEPRFGKASGATSVIVGRFVKKFSEEVKRRWPDKKVTFLPYWNYAFCPEDIDFPDNLEIEMATTGLGGFRDPVEFEGISKQLCAWSRKVGGRITTWEYSCWYAGWTHGPVQYPNIIKKYYSQNRDVLAGSFLNGGWVPEWTKAAPTLYCWMKVLWNPDIDIDAVLDEMCVRLFGPGATTSRELLRLMVDRWEKAPNHPLGTWNIFAQPLSPAIFADTWPPEVVAQMEKLWRKAREEMKDDPLALRRFDYWTWAFEAFLKEAPEEWQKAGLKATE